MKLFRKFRFKMLNSQRVSKYLIYALGEIILVVIGILIALQINNWNQERSLRSQEMGYLKNIKANLEEDKLRAENSLNANAKKRTVLEGMTPFFDSSKSRTELVRYIVPDNMPVIGSFELFDINRTAFGNMVSANDITIISNETLRYDLSAYYAKKPFVGTQERVKESSRNFRDYMAMNMINKEAIDNYMQINSMLPSITEIDDFRKDVNFYTYYFDVLVISNSQDELIKSYLDEIDALISGINNELKE